MDRVTIEALKTQINLIIKQNGKQQISGNSHNSLEHDIVDTLISFLSKSENIIYDGDPVSDMLYYLYQNIGSNTSDLTPFPLDPSTVIDLTHPFSTSNMILVNDTNFSPNTDTAIENFKHRMAIDLNGRDISFSEFSPIDSSTPNLDPGYINLILFYKLGEGYWFQWSGSYLGSIEDTTAPIINSVTISDITTSGAQLNASGNENMIFRWAIFAHGYDWGSATEDDKRTAILNGTGAINYDSFNVTVGLTGYNGLPSLDSTTEYDVYYYAQDASDNYGNVYLISFTTI